MKAFVSGKRMMHRVHYPYPLGNKIVNTLRPRSFLADREGVKGFVDLLGSKERQMLFDELNYRKDSSIQLIIEMKENEKLAPTVKQLKQIAFHQAIPFIGFGFLDNLIMILAGDYIDTKIGITLGISTMTAAGLGNAISDVAGVGSAWYVENLAAKVGVEYPKITPVQAEMFRTRMCIQFGRMLGVFLGCLIGISPLLFIPTREKSKDG